MHITSLDLHTNPVAVLTHLIFEESDLGKANSLSSFLQCYNLGYYLVEG